MMSDHAIFETPSGLKLAEADTRPDGVRVYRTDAGVLFRTLSTRGRSVEDLDREVAESLCQARVIRPKGE
jgi:hypothetical protein